MERDTSQYRYNYISVLLLTTHSISTVCNVVLSKLQILLLGNSGAAPNIYNSQIKLNLKKAKQDPSFSITRKIPVLFPFQF